MRAYLTTILIVLAFSPGFMSCTTEQPTPETEQPGPPGGNNIPGASDKDDEENNDQNNDFTNPKLSIRIGSTSFTVTMERNVTTTAFNALLPMTISMSELNGNEKYYNLSADLPTAPIRPGTIRTGDLMLFGSNCVVLFYGTFSSSYSYTRLGRVNDPSGLAAALGPGGVIVKFDLPKE